MTQRVVLGTLAVLPLLLVANPAQASPKPLEGHWHADLGRSVDPYRAKPKSVTLDIVVADGHVFESKEIVISANGKTTTEATRVSADGKFYPVQGSPNAVSVAVTHWDAGSIHFEFRAPGGLHGIEVCRLSADLNTLVCDERDTNLKGRSTFARSVYIRD